MMVIPAKMQPAQVKPIWWNFNEVRGLARTGEGSMSERGMGKACSLPRLCRDGVHYPLSLVLSIRDGGQVICHAGSHVHGKSSNVMNHIESPTVPHKWLLQAQGDIPISLPYQTGCSSSMHAEISAWHLQYSYAFQFTDTYRLLMPMVTLCVYPTIHAHAAQYIYSGH